MPTSLETAVAKYLRSGNPAQRTREEYSTTLRKWTRWGGAISVEKLGRKEIRAFLDWVYEDAAGRDGGNPGRTANKVRSHLRAVMAWAWEQDMVDVLPRFAFEVNVLSRLLLRIRWERGIFLRFPADETIEYPERKVACCAVSDSPSERREN